MKLRNLSFAALAAVMLASCGEEAKKEAVVVDVVKNYTLDTTSMVNWKGQMIGGLHFHTGTLNLSKGSVTVTNGAVSGGTFEINWNSMATTDSNYSKEQPSAYLIQHLKATDFFATDSLGAATFEITGVDSTDGSLMGKLTVRGVTNEEKVTDVVVTETENGVEATGKMTFDRQKYGASYKNSYSDAIISDDIELTISLKGTAATEVM